MELIASIRSACLAAIGFAILLMGVQNAFAHGERAQEPYLRTRTMQFYDVNFSKTKVQVNEEFEITGKVRLMTDWPDAVSDPDVVYLSAVSPGPVVARVETWVNGKPARQSFSKLERGRDYEFRIVLKARSPGYWHVHPSLAVKGSGALVGPGQWIDVGGSASDFAYPITTITNEKIDDLQTYALAYVGAWHGVWIGLAAFWLLFWLARPLLLPRWVALQKGREDVLISVTDIAVGLVLAVVVLGLAFGGYSYATSRYSYNVPLQSGTQRVDPLPVVPANAAVRMIRANYDVPGRSMRLLVQIKNNGTEPLTIGELTTANIRFLNQASEAASASVNPQYPKDLVARSGLKISDASPINPGESREVLLEATDAVWEVERLVSFLTDVDSKVGALLFFYSPKGERNIAEVSGPIIPVFTQL
jgi:methane/ammonia monooxygenase subunit B